MATGPLAVQTCSWLPGSCVSGDIIDGWARRGPYVSCTVRPPGPVRFDIPQTNQRQNVLRDDAL